MGSRRNNAITSIHVNGGRDLLHISSRINTALSLHTVITEEEKTVKKNQETWDNAEDRAGA